MKELLQTRKTILKYVNIKEGKHDSNLCFKLSSNKQAFRFKYNLDHSDYIKHLEREFKVKAVSSVESNMCYLHFEPEGNFFDSQEVDLTLGGFLYVSKNEKTLSSFFEHFSIGDDYSVGCNSAGALLRVAMWLKEYKSKFWLEMTKYEF